MHLSISKTKNAKSFYMLKSVWQDGKHTTKIVEKLGTEEDIKKAHPDVDPLEWAKAYVKEQTRLEKEGREPDVIAKFSPIKTLTSQDQKLYFGGYLFLQKIYHELGIHKICKAISTKYKFKYDLGSILSRLVYGRITNPCSKLGTMEYSKKLIEQPNFELHQIYRALEVLAKENDFIQSEVYKNSLKLSKRNNRILYYDCTNYFFEIEEEDDFRMYGHCKENRPNPIVQMGLFLDGDGIPLAFSITPGNVNEQTTLKPLEEKIIKDFSNSNFVVCTDAGLSSTANRKFNNLPGRGFITTQSIKKMKNYQKEWALSPDGWKLSGHSNEFNLDEVLSDESKFEKFKNEIFYKERWINENGLEQRFIVNFSIKYMLYHRQLREKQMQRAENLLTKPSMIGKARQTDPKRFIKESRATKDGEIAEKKIYEIDQEKYYEESRFDGFYAIATNLEDDAKEIVKISSERWQIEESFRIMKSEFNARPVYLSREDRITAHFLTCFLALTIYKYLEKKISGDFTSHEIIKSLREMEFLKIKGDGYIPAYTRTNLTDKLHETFGFRTDYEIVTNKKIKEIIKNTKK